MNPRLNKLLIDFIGTHSNTDSKRVQVVFKQIEHPEMTQLGYRYTISVIYGSWMI